MAVTAIHREAGMQHKMENRPSLEHLITNVLRKCLLMIVCFTSMLL